MRPLAFLFCIRFFFCALLLGSAAPGAFAQKKRKEPELPPAPPPVVAQEVSVTLGEPVTIRLGIHGRRTEQLEFLVKSRPKTGKLSAITTTGANSAEVVYTPPAETEAEGDRFTYSVRSKDGVSAPGAVTVKFVEKPAPPVRLNVPDVVSFPAVAPGQRSTAVLEISNPGLVMVEGELTVPPPWSIEGSPSYRLGSKAQTTFTLVFRPEKPGSHTGEAVFGPNPRRVVALTGEAMEPFVVTPRKLVLKASERGQTRSGALEIKNQTNEARTISVVADARLLTDKTVTLPPGEKVTLPVFAEPGDGAAFLDSIRLSEGDQWRTEIIVEAEPLRRMMKLIGPSPSTIPVPAGAAPSFEVAIENEGGRPLTAQLLVNSPFRAEEAKVTLGAGEKKSVRIVAEPLPGGEHVAEVTAQTDAALQRVAVTCVVEKPAPPARAPVSAMPAALGKPRSQPASLAESDDPAEDEPAERSRSVLAAPRSTRMEDHPNALGLFHREVGDDRATLAWPAKLDGGAKNLVVEERKLGLVGAGDLAMTWAPMKSARIEAGTDPRTAELTGLAPSRQYTVRVRAGEETIFTAQFTTKQEKPWLSIGWQGGVLIALSVAAIALGWRVWRNRRVSGW